MREKTLGSIALTCTLNSNVHPGFSVDAPFHIKRVLHHQQRQTDRNIHTITNTVNKEQLGFNAFAQGHLGTTTSMDSRLISSTENPQKASSNETVRE